MHRRLPKLDHQRKNILYYYSHHHFDTGSPKALVGIIDLLDTSQYKPYFLATADGPLIKELLDRNVEIIKARVNNIELSNIFSIISNIIKLSKLLKQYNIKLIHINEYGSNFDLVLAGKLVGIPISLHIHNPEDLRKFNFHTLLADNIFLVSNAVRKVIKGFDKIKHKTTLLYNFVSISNIEKGYSIRNTLGFNDDDIVIGVIGQITPEKGTDILIEIAERLIKKHRNLNFIFAGRTGENQEHFLLKITEYIKTNKLEKNIHILGIRNDVPNILASINIFCLATIAETFCIAIVEAMAAKLPIVASAVGAIPELMSEDCGVLVFERSVDDFVKHIEWLIDHPDEAQQLGMNAKKSIRGRLDRDTCSMQLHNAYSTLIKNKNENYNPVSPSR